MKNIRERLEGFLNRLERAETILLEGRIHRVEGLAHTYVVRGSERLSTGASRGPMALHYLVDLERETCTCPDAAKGHTCKHLLAALLLERGEERSRGEARETAKAA
ncbi:zinc finger SWIM domain protein [Allomeiothermus silvanus DSM 9946]|uniref:Zinc finger SWIM domain protein n=1 Tax=Allomeiothermus silvanus (strain ATCC 700542 / DSM 9946 / NBRC 106475 / NCIMB 13440 / VI-R2) TaxID=526227 RepID=D7BAH1_ALLS1|nr:SWIM zinc finger family protein [Allomeiothermus silvanus]ADH62493.1 zinc finger SWIM domain protein [Allomeiothermus silvanus DSM 9946]